jgi:hypothetical protein
MPEIHFDRFYRYSELTALAQAFAAEYPHLAKIESIGSIHALKGGTLRLVARQERAGLLRIKVKLA